METIERMIVNAVMAHTETDPVAIFNAVAALPFVRMHGPEHHILDGACLLTAYRNAGGDINLAEGMEWMIQQGLRMPGAACAHWGVCGATTSMGAALSFIDGTGPLSTDGTWGKHMLFTAKAIEKMGRVNGPRCCKRDAYLTFETAIDFVAEHYGVVMTKSQIQCHFSPKNQQCLGGHCPFFVK